MRNKSSYLILCVCLGAGLNATLGQMPPAVVGSDFTATVPIFIAPGGLTTIFVQGIGSKIVQPVVAATVPLPTKLGGISVSLKQTESPQGPIAVPLLAVFPVNACRSLVFQPCSTITGINLQIPFELVPTSSTPPILVTNYAQLVVSEEGGGQATRGHAPD
jgi:uncharacterized protein (TIGR03437 family)